MIKTKSKGRKEKKIGRHQVSEWLKCGREDETGKYKGDSDQWGREEQWCGQEEVDTFQNVTEDDRQWWQRWRVVVVVAGGGGSRSPLSTVFSAAVRWSNSRGKQSKSRPRYASWLFSLFSLHSIDGHFHLHCGGVLKCWSAFVRKKIVTVQAKNG